MKKFGGYPSLVSSYERRPDLEQAFTRLFTKNDVNLILRHGPEHVGKTTLVRRYVEDKNDQIDSVFWINCNTRTDYVQSLKKISKKIIAKITDPELQKAYENISNVDMENQIALHNTLLREYLSQNEDVPFYVVYDGINQHASVRLSGLCARSPMMESKPYVLN